MDLSSDSESELPRRLERVRPVLDLTSQLTDGQDLPGVQDLRSRVQNKKFALTYPQCDCFPQLALETIISREEVQKLGVECCVVAQEEHKDGNKHLHVFLILSSPFRYQKGEGTTWDFVTGQHGNYQQMRDPAAWLKYVIKGGNYVTYPEDFDPQSFIASRKKKTSYKAEVVAKQIMKGERNISVLLEEFPGFMLVNQRKVVDLINLCEDLDSQNKPTLSFPDVVEVDELSAKEIVVLKWFVAVQRGDFNEEYFPHLRIQGPTGIGKTRLTHMLMSWLKLYSVVYETNWWDMFSEDACDILVFDEYKSQKPINFINRLADGYNVPLPRRGVRPYVLKTRVPLLILTNFSWEESYPNVYQNTPVAIEAAQRRFNTVVFEGEENLFKLIELLQKWQHQATI